MIMKQAATVIMLVSAALVLVASLLWMGAYPKTISIPLPYPVIEYQIITQTEYIERWHEPQIVTVNVTETREVLVEVVKERFIEKAAEFKEWESMGQVEDMLKGIVTPLQPDSCLQIAESLQMIALENGYIVSVAPSWNHYFYGQYVTAGLKGHAGLLVDIKGDWYFIDPLPWKVTKLFSVRTR